MAGVLAENQVVLSYGQVAEGHKNDLFGRTLHVLRCLKVKWPIKNSQNLLESLLVVFSEHFEQFGTFVSFAIVLINL